MALNNLKSGYLGILHWQFLVAVGLLCCTTCFVVIKSYGAISYQFFGAITAMVLLGLFVFRPYFEYLRTTISPFQRAALSLVFSLAILASPLSIWLSGKHGRATTEVPTYTSAGSALVSIEFKLVPYARVYDVTETEKAPRFLFESHYKILRFKPGVYVFRFDYAKRTKKRKVDLTGSKECVVVVDLRF